MGPSVKMAGGSVKKNQDSNTKTLAFRLQVTVGIVVAYVAWRIVYHYESWGMWNGIAFAIALAGIATSYRMFQSMADGHLHDITKVGEVWSDLFYVSLATLALATFSDWGWLLYLAVPGYAIWSMVISPLLNWVFTEEKEEDRNSYAGMTRKDRRAAVKAEKRGMKTKSTSSSNACPFLT